MGRQYRHLTLAEREDIMVHWKNRVGVSEIARLVGRDKSTVSREIRRNGWYSPVAGRMWCYRASTAHDKSQRRARRCRRQPLLADPRRLELVARLIRDRHWSPEQIEGRIMIERPDLGVSDTTIYRAVHSGLLDHTLGGHKKMSARLRHRRRRRKVCLDGRGRITITHELGERPAIADRRERVGDWEGDTVAGRMSGAVLVTPARPGHRVPGGRQGPLQTRGGRLIGHRAGPGPPHRRPLTVDRGHEFALGPALQESLGAPIYFCQARCPWQRGTNENTNGLLREYFPKRTPLDGINPTRIQQVHNQLNQRPRKRLGWKTPEEAYTHRTLHFL